MTKNKPKISKVKLFVLPYPTKNTKTLYLLDFKYAKLSFNRNKKIKIKDENIFFGYKKITYKFSKQERTVLIKLIKNKEDVVMHDQIAQVLWGDKAEEKYSLWAITKVIQKIRNKLANYNADHLIHTVYGKGYCLVN